MDRGLREGRRTSPADDPTARRSSPRRALVSGCIGNVVEWYDLALYGAFATVLARVFFPSGDRHASLLATFAVFSTAFIVRPVGAVLLGPETWGWRLAFLLALPMGLVGLYLRLRLDETPRFRAVQRVRDVAQWPVSEALRAYPGPWRSC
jgi:MFS family permease